MKDAKKVSELISLHLELKGEGEILAETDLNGLSELDLNDSTLPPRRVIFPSKKPRLTRIFYNTLFVLFLLLVIGLTLWGARMN